MDTDETPIENPTKHSIKLAKEAHRRLDNGLQSFKKIRVQFFSALGVIISLSSVVIWRTSAVVKELEFTNRRLDRIENVLYRKDLAMETCAGCGKQTKAGLINVVVINHQLTQSNCEHCADRNDYRTPEAWKGNRISETTTIDSAVNTPPEQVNIGSSPSMIINDTVQLSHDLNEAEERNPGFIRSYADQKLHEMGEAAKKKNEEMKADKPVSDLPPELQRLKDAHEARLKAVKDAQESEDNS